MRYLEVPLYEKHGVKEYWVIYPSENCVVVYKLSSDGKYQAPLMFTSSDVVNIETLNELKIDLSEVFSVKRSEKKEIKRPPKNSML